MGARDHPSVFEQLDAVWAEYFKAPPRITVTEWAELYRGLSSKDSAEPGPYRCSRTPYVREPQDALSTHSLVEEIVLMWGAQTGKTTIGSNWMGYIADVNPGPAMIVQPTIDMAKRYSRQRLVPMVDESPALKRKVSENRSRDDANTTLLKEYPGGQWALAGANSAAGLRSMPVRDLFMDEIDAWPHDVDGEGDPSALAEARQSTFARRKRLKTSTPTIKGYSRVEAEYMASDRCQYWVPCPHCGEMQTLEWGAQSPHGVKWHKDADGQAMPETAHYVCRHNGCVIEEYHKPGMLEGGQWIAAMPGAKGGKVRGFQINSLYSPLGWLTWSEVVREWLTAQTAKRNGDNSKLRAFVNTRLAETYEESGTGADSRALAARAEDYEIGIVPRGGLMVTMGVDTQPDRLEARIWAFGRGEESWLCGRHIIYGDPNLDENTEGSPWTRLTEIRRTPLLHASGAQMVIEATCVDTGGHNTNAVYSYCRNHAHAQVLAVKGASLYGRPVIGKPSLIDVTWRGKTQPRSLKLWSIGTDTAKHLLYGRMRITQTGPGYVHVPKSLAPTDEFEQMTAARLMPVVVQGKASMRWITPAGKREEGGDCMVYAYAAACHLGIQTYREPGWARREEKYAPKAPDLFNQPEKQAETASPQRETVTDSYKKWSGTPNAPPPAAKPPAARTFARDW